MGNGALLANVMSALAERSERQMDRSAQRRRDELDRYRATLGSVNQGIESGARALGSFLDSENTRKAQKEEMAFRVGQALREQERHNDNLRLQQAKMEQDALAAKVKAEQETREWERQIDIDALNKRAIEANINATTANQTRLANKAQQEEADRRTLVAAQRELNAPSVQETGIPTASQQAADLGVPGPVGTFGTKKFVSDEAKMQNALGKAVDSPDAWAFLQKYDLANKKADLAAQQEERKGQPKPANENAITALYIKEKGPRPKMSDYPNLADLELEPIENWTPEDFAEKEKYDEKLLAWEDGLEAFKAQRNSATAPTATPVTLQEKQADLAEAEKEYQSEPDEGKRQRLMALINRLKAEIGNKQPTATDWGQ